ncbi:hypothetical protein POM88_019659 [Heracleum sosnowskyi]|uniref:PB1-like domain-containing protein n=1 Tax=Heracleum sosnowskyi TaxID=360622 RepID=A0AAD8IA31_9APIA|nr:hypothetical protein POM88_019659 [Heracleum sosnowskyi]
MSTRVSIYLHHPEDFSPESFKGNDDYVEGSVDIIDDVDTDKFSILEMDDYAMKYKYSKTYLHYFQTDGHTFRKDKPPSKSNVLEKDDELSGSVVDGGFNDIEDDLLSDGFGDWCSDDDGDDPNYEADREEESNKELIDARKLRQKNLDDSDENLIVIVATISSEFSSEFYIIGVLIGVLIVIDVFMDSHRSSILGTKRRVRGRNVETVLQRSNYDENQGANRRVRGKNVSNVLSSADSTNNKENYSPNVASVSTNLRRLPQSILHDPAILSSGHVGKNITGKNVSKCRVRGKNVDNIMSNVSKQAYSRPPLTTIDQNSQSPFVSQSSGSSISSKSHMTPRTTFHSRMETINLSGDMQRNQTNNNHKNTCESGQSTLTFSMPASTLKPINKRRPDYKKQHPHDETEQHVAKKRCGKMSPIPFSVGKDGVRSSFEVGETSGPINLMSDFNNVEDTFSSESDSLEQGIFDIWSLSIIWLFLVNFI